jgi:RNA polymerase sigma-54 factor
MAIDQRLNMKLDQKLVMTPQLQLAIKILQMPTQDLQDFIGQEMMDNPFLTNDDGTSEETNDHSDQSSAEEIDSSKALESENIGAEVESLDMGWDSMYDSGTSYSGGQNSFDDNDESSWEKTTASKLSLKDHLHQQVGEVTDDPKLHFMCFYLIDSIDDAGYMRGDTQRIAERLNVEIDVIEDALELLQTLDPAGVGARNLKECLTLQLELDVKLKGERLEKASKVIQNLELLAQKDFKRLARVSGCDLTEVAEICALITTLTPKPGLQYGSDVSTNVIPDVVVMKKEGVWCSELNVEAMPKILLNSGYQTQMASRKGDEKSYVNERVGRAQWLIKSLEQRARTIFKVSNAIVRFQNGFFDFGMESLKPMTLKMIAEKVGVHESTVSRVTNGKYMQTPMGVFEMKYFFSSAIGTTGGNMSVASESVRQIIKRLIAAESTDKPLSDEKLVHLLKEEGVDVARRTVAKYREGLGIPSSSGRRIRA